MAFQAIRSLGALIIQKETEKMSVLHKTKARFIQEPCFSFCIWVSYKLLKMYHLTLCVYVDMPHLHEGNNFQEFLSHQFWGSSSGHEAASALTCGAVSAAWRFYCIVCLSVCLFVFKVHIQSGG